MTALTSDRSTPERLGDYRAAPVAANVKIHDGALLMRDVNGNVKPGAIATGSVGVGRAENVADNTGGQAGDITVSYRSGIFAFENSGGGDAIDATDTGNVCYIVDDQTLAATDGSCTRSPAGFVDEVDGSKIWARFDEALTGLV
jgi:predicted RecA/RadA family phage recombinase